MSTTSEALVTAAAESWVTLGVRGLLAILFGILAFAWPGITLFVLVLLFAAYALADGVFAFVGAYRAAESNRSVWPFLLEGVLGVVTGIAAFAWPNITAVALVYLIAGWAIVTGALELYAAIQLRKQLTDELWLGAGGLLSILFGVLIAAVPGTGALAVVWVIAAYAVLFGVTLLALAWRMRSERSTPESGRTSPSV